MSDATKTIVNAPRQIQSGSHPAPGFQLITTLAGSNRSVVYKARQALNDRIVAVKMLSPSLLSHPGNWQRFQQEVKTTCSLDHPNIINVFSYGIDKDDRPYFVMEYFDGKTLRALLNLHGRLDLTGFFSIFSQICSALAYAHSKGIVHRDLKPENIMVSNSREGIPEVKLLDFGIAVQTAAEIGNNNFTFNTVPAGSPYYMSPEQCLCRKVNSKSDIYSLGAVMYEALCGQAPFQGGSPQLLMMKHVSESPPPFSRSAKDLKVPPSLRRLIFQCLQKDPDLRPSSLDEVIEALDRAQTESPTPVSRFWVLKQPALYFQIAAALSAAAISTALAASFADSVAAKGKVFKSEQRVSLKHSIDRHLHKANQYYECGDFAGSQTQYLDTLKLLQSQGSIMDPLNMSVAKYKCYRGLSFCNRHLQVSNLVGDHRNFLNASIKTFGKDSFPAAEAQFELATILSSLPDAESSAFPEIESLLKASIKIHRERIRSMSETPYIQIVITQSQLKKDLSLLSANLGLLGSLYERKADYCRALPLLRESLNIRRSVSEEDDLSTLWALQRLARALHGNHKHTDEQLILNDLLMQVCKANNEPVNEKHILLRDLIRFYSRDKCCRNNLKLLADAESLIASN